MGLTFDYLNPAQRFRVLRPSDGRKKSIDTYSFYKFQAYSVNPHSLHAFAPAKNQKAKNFTTPPNDGYPQAAFGFELALSTGVLHPITPRYPYSTLCLLAKEETA